MKWEGISTQVIPIPANIHDTRSIPEVYLLIFEEFFESIRIHNHLFIDTAYSLLGFMEVEDILHAVLSQPAVNSTRGAVRSQVQTYMAKFGFHHVGNDHYESESLLIQDLHDENVLVGYDGRLYFIDTCIYVKAGESFPIGLE